MKDLKKKIIRICKSYVSNTKGRRKISDVAKYFNIPIDKTRENDYFIKAFNADDLSIEIFDSGTNITYKACYTAVAKMLSIYCSETSFIQVISSSEVGETEYIYLISTGELLGAKMRFVKDADEIVIFKREEDDIDEFVNGRLLSIGYSKGIDVDGKKWRKHYIQEFCENMPYYEAKDSVFTNLNGAKKDYSCSNGNVAYVHRNMPIDEHFESIVGICFEHFNFDNLKGLSSDDMEIAEKIDEFQCYGNSALIFEGFTNRNVTGDLKKEYGLEIYKSDSIRIKYRIVRSRTRRRPDEELFYQEIFLPSLTAGDMTVADLNNVINVLSVNYGDDPFIIEIVGIIKTFVEKISISKGLIKKEENLLNPDSLIDLPLSDLEQYFVNNLEECFKTGERLLGLPTDSYSMSKVPKND